MPVFITNIPTPYRTAFFDVMAVVCAERTMPFKVIYCAESEPNRHWPFEPEKMRHPFEVLPGWHPSIGGAHPHVNPSVICRLRALRPDVLICGSAWNTPTIQLAATKWLWGGKRTVFWSEGHQQSARHAQGAIAALRRLAYRRFDAFAVPNSRSAAWARRNSRSDAIIMTLPNTVDETFYERKNEDERRIARHDLKIPGSTFLFIQVSRLSEAKGVPAAVAVVHKIRTELNTDIAIAVVGSGPSEEMLRQTFASNQGNPVLYLPGQLDPAGVRRWLMAADCFVLNTELDANPLSPIEASMAELPICMTRLAGNALELVHEGDTGFMIEDPKNPYDALKNASIAGRSALTRMGQNAKRNAMMHFQRRTVCESFVNQIAALR